MANVAGTLTNTIQNVDSLDGGAGTDTLNITHNTATLVTPVLKNIENVVFRATAAGADIDFVASTGVTSISVENSTAATGVIDNVGAADLAVKNQNTAVSFDHQTGTTLNIAFDTVGVVSATAPTEVAVDIGAANASKATTVNITVKSGHLHGLHSVLTCGANSGTISPMSSAKKILEQLRREPTNVRFADLRKVCEAFFGEPRQNGTSYLIFKMPWQGDPRVNIQDAGGKAKPYQVRQVLQAIDKLEGRQ